MHDVRREIVARGRTTDAHGPGYLDPPFILLKFRLRPRGPLADALKFQEGVALMGTAGSDHGANAMVIDLSGILGLAIGFLADKNCRLLIDTITQRIFTLHAIEVGIERGAD